MLDQPITSAAFLLALGPGDKPPGLPSIFQVGDRVLEIGADLSRIPAGTPTQRIAVLGALTTDYLIRAVACAVLPEGELPILYQAPFESWVQEVLNPAPGLFTFGPELVVIAPHWRDIVAPVPIDASADAVDAALESKVSLLWALWNQLVTKG